MRAQKALRADAFLEHAQRLAKEITAAGRPDPCVVVGGFDPIDVAHRRRHSLGGATPNHLEAVDARHLDVEKERKSDVTDKALAKERTKSVELQKLVRGQDRSRRGQSRRLRERQEKTKRLRSIGAVEYVERSVKSALCPPSLKSFQLLFRSSPPSEALASVAGLRIDDIAQLLAAQKTVKVVAEQIDGFVPMRRAKARAVRRDDDVRQRPVWTRWLEWLVIEDVEHRAADLAAPQRLLERVVVDDLPARDVDDHRAGIEQRELCGADHP
jgi:hypothetical protein